MLAMSAARCGGTSSHHDAPVATGGAAGGGGTAGGMAGSGGGGAAFAGAPSGGANSFPCGSATPLAGASTGFEHCGRGYTRRTMPGTCVANLPRSGPIENYNAAIDQCERDADCSETVYGPYAHCGIRDGGFAHECVGGCVEDTDCDSGELCFCGEPVGRCVPGSCTKGGDCAPGFDCASFAAMPGCFSTRFACQAAGDTCAGDGDCAGFSPNIAFCIVENGVRACSINQCTTP